MKTTGYKEIAEKLTACARNVTDAAETGDLKSFHTFVKESSRISAAAERLLSGAPKVRRGRMNASSKADDHEIQSHIHPMDRAKTHPLREFKPIRRQPQSE